MRPNVILAEVNGHRHSSKCFSENVVVAKTLYQMLGILSFSDRERALFPSTGKSRTNCCGEKNYNDVFRGF